MPSKSYLYQQQKKASMRYAGADRINGKIRLYYDKLGSQIIVQDGNKEYLFNSLKDAKSKLKFTLKKYKNYFPADDVSDFIFDVESGLYYRFRKDSEVSN